MNIDEGLEVSVEQLASECRGGGKVAVLDVRETWETDICSIEGSINIPLGVLPESLAELPQEEPLVVVCHHGARSMHAVLWLRAQGFRNAVNLRGGIDAWARAVDPAMATY